MLVITFPLKCRTLIDERKQLSPEDLECLWQQLRDIAEWADESRENGDPPEDAISGGIAVLFILHRSWLEADSEREEWCGAEFGKVLESPPPHPFGHVAESSSNYHWNNFAAMIAAQTLAEDPGHKGARSLCADFALAFNYSVIQVFMQTAFEHREALGEDFQRLQYLVLVSSGWRNIREVTKAGNSVWDCPDVAFDYGTRINRLIDQFVKTETPLELPSLLDIAEEATGEIADMVRQQHAISHKESASEDVQHAIRKRIKRCRGFEPLHLHAGLGWLAQIDRVKDPEERERWIRMVESLILASLRPLGGIEEAVSDVGHNGEDFFIHPSDPDVWLFDLVAVVIPKLDSNENPSRLWKPYLSYGLDRLHWVDSFLSAWFTHGLQVGNDSRFFSQWEEMIEYAWDRENWRHSQVRNHRGDEDIFRHLMGFSRFSFGYFEDEKFRPYLSQMKAHYDRWTAEFFPHPEATSAFAAFLTSPAAVDFLRDGVAKLADASSQFEDWHWRDFYHLESALLKLLEHDRRENSGVITTDQKVRAEFSKLLKTMTDRQSQRALTLQDKMLRVN